MDQKIEDVFRPDLGREDFARLALDLLRRQSWANPVYRRFLEASGFQARKAGHWKEFPALPVEAFRLEPVVSFPVEEAELIFETSGTTGRAAGRHYLRDGRSYEKALEAGFLHFMPDLSSHRWISLIPPFDLRPHSSLSYMVRHLAGTVPRNFPVEYVCDADFVLDQDRFHGLLRQAAGHGEKVLLLGTSFALALAGEGMVGRGQEVQLPTGSVIFDTGGYKGRHRELAPDQFLELMERSFGVARQAVWNEYGMTELSSQGYGRLGDGRHSFPPWLEVRVMDPATGTDAPEGRRGLLHFYDLANVHSVMAVATLDTGIREGGAIRLTGRLSGAPQRGCSLPFEV